MNDTELYRQPLGLVAPWQVNRVDLSAKEAWIDVWVDHPRRTRFTCPECERELPVYDHAEERERRHLDSCQFLTCLHARLPRVNCPGHGVVQMRLPWAEPMSRILHWLGDLTSRSTTTVVVAVVLLLIFGVILAADGLPRLD